MSNKFKNILLVILILLFIAALILIFYLVPRNNNQVRTITGEVIVSDTKYVIIKTDKEDYVISNIKGSYNIGDEVKFTYNETDLDNKSIPKNIKITDEELIKVSSNNILDNEDNINDNNDNITSTDNNITDSNVTQDNLNNSNTSNNSSYNSSKNNDTSNKTNSSTSTNTNITSNNSNNTSNSNTNGNNNSSSVNSLNDSNLNNKDTEVINYINTYKTNIDKGNITDDIKSGFITVVDFLFYNGTIKGYTFNELTSTAKLKVLSLAMYLDSKIEKYFPGYKETISNTTSKIYTNIKSKIVEAYLNITTSICSTNEELCNSAKNNFKELKTNFNITWEFLKDLAGDGINNLKNWYEIWKEK